MSLARDSIPRHLTTVLRCAAYAAWPYRATLRFTPGSQTLKRYVDICAGRGGNPCPPILEMTKWQAKRLIL